jgi:DNA-binding NtrC family response regulator
MGRIVIGQSAAMNRVRHMVEICARTDANVLLSGETGVGKDLLASIIHRHSHRASFPLVKVGCALFPPQLIESELYGHVKGSFTGADQQRQGRFDLAEGGTLYLDDVDDIPLEQQSKLLRAIEEKVFERVGGTQLIRANVRIVASTKQNLLEKSSAGTFRQDLYYRLDVLRISIPPLRDRREDIPLLVQHLLKRLAGDQPCQIEPAVVDRLQQHDWPGNVRELYHTLERALLVGGGRITADLLSAELGSIMTSAATAAVKQGFQAAMDHAERELLANALRASGGNKTAAAASLGMKPSTFRDKLAKHGLG